MYEKVNYIRNVVVKEVIAASVQHSHIPSKYKSTYISL